MIFMITSIIKKISLSILTLIFLQLYPGSHLDTIFPQISDESVNRTLTQEEVQELIRRITLSFSKIKDYRATFIKQERFGERFEPEIIRLYFKKPFNVKMEWIDPHKGQVAVYREGFNNNKVRARKGGFLKFIIFNLDPEGRAAMRNNHHPITRAGIGNVIDILSRDINKGGKYRIVFRGEEKIEDHKTLKFEAISGEKEGFHYAPRSIIWISKELNIPIKHEHYDRNNLIFERYVYKNLEINVGLEDSDFDF